jgi:hypothetical protein
MNKGNIMRDAENEICIYLEKKLGMFKEYLSVTEKMKHIVCGNNENNELSGLINKRQKCIIAIEKINFSMEKIIKNGSLKFSCISKKYKGLAESCLSKIKEIMTQVALVDRELAAMVTEQGENIKIELIGMRNMRQAAKGYKTIKQYPARFLDTRS